METKGYNSFSIARAKELFLTDNIINIGDDFILAERTNEANYDLLRYPCRVDAYVAAFCKQGSFKCSINLKEYEIHETKAAPGYAITNATAKADDSTYTQITEMSDGVFTLLTPGTERVEEPDIVTVTNPQELLEISGVKDWADADDDDEIRPNSVTVILSSDDGSPSRTTRN